MGIFRYAAGKQKHTEKMGENEFKKKHESSSSIYESLHAEFMNEHT